MSNYYNDYSYYGDYGSGIDALDILSFLPDLISKIGFIFSLIAIAVGIVQCFWGYKFYRFTIAVSGFLTGSVIGAAIGIFMAAGSNSNDLKSAATIVLVIMLICGLIGAKIAYSFELVGAFLVGFSGVYVVSLVYSLVIKAISNDDQIASSFFIAIIPAVIAGILVVKFWKPIVIIYTSISGALYIAVGSKLGILAFILCCVGGLYYQIKSNNGLKENANNNENTNNIENNNGNVNKEHKSSVFNYKPIDYKKHQPVPNDDDIHFHQNAVPSKNTYPDIID